MRKILFIAMLLYSQSSFAQTIIGTSYFLNKQVVWSKAGSPYIIRGPITLSSSTLKILDAKVIVENGTIGLYDQSVLDIKNSDIVSSLSVNAIASFNSKVLLNHVSIDTKNFISAYKSNIEIDTLDSFNSHNTELFSLYDWSNFSMKNSRIENYKGMVFNFYHTNEINILGTEFINNDKVIDLHHANILNINQNDFELNNIAVESYMYDNDNTRINLENNYYQKDNIRISVFKEDSDPNEINSLIGPFGIERFSKQKNIQRGEVCCSNILFLPGMMGSRLYSGNNQLWEPNKNADVKKLFMDNFGQSIEDVFTKDIIARTNLLNAVPGIDQDIYIDFVDYLNGLKEDQLIHDYNAMPYDWRMSPDTILEAGVLFKDKRINIFSVLEELQKTSKTKKVTIITHSNGGLVAKRLFQYLQMRGLDKMIDRIIFVAMPEFGTPQAITSLMYGHNQSILGGLILKSSTAKELGKNMPTAYALLPSKKYYQNKNIGEAKITLLLDDFDNLNRSLLNKAEELHDTLDNISYPDYVGIYNILGTGLHTVFDIRINSSKITPLYDKNGDGVVQDLYGLHFGTTTYIDLNGSKYKHSNIMNSPAVISDIDRIIHPSKYTGEHLGLDYNKIIKNNNYKLLRISKSKNKLSEYLTPLDMDLSIGVTKQNQNTDNELFFDRYSAISRGEFRQVKESLDKNNRFELIDDDINYLFTSDMDNFSIQSKTNNTINIDILESIDGEIRESEYKDISLFKNARLIFESDNDFNSLNVTLPLTGQIIELESERMRLAASIEEKVDKAISDIESSRLDRYVKSRYVRRLQLYKENKDSAYLKTMKARVVASIDSINSMSHSLALAARYAKLKEDYVYLNLLLLKL